MASFGRGDWSKESALVLNQTANLIWIVSTLTGAYIGQFIPPSAFGMDYALTGMFICLLVFQLRGSIFAVTALIAALFSVTAYLLLPGNAYVIVASIAAATIGLLLKRMTRKRRVLS